MELLLFKSFNPIMPLCWRARLHHTMMESIKNIIHQGAALFEVQHTRIYTHAHPDTGMDQFFTSSMTRKSLCSCHKSAGVLRIWCALNVCLFIIMHSQWAHNGQHEKSTIEFTYSNLYFAYKRIIACLQVLLIFRIKASVLGGKLQTRHS